MRHNFDKVVTDDERYDERFWKLGITHLSRSRSINWLGASNAYHPCFDSLNYSQQCNRRVLFRVCTSKCKVQTHRYINHKIAFRKRLHSCESIKCNVARLENAELYCSRKCIWNKLNGFQEDRCQRNFIVFAAVTENTYSRKYLEICKKIYLKNINI